MVNEWNQSLCPRCGEKADSGGGRGLRIVSCTCPSCHYAWFIAGRDDLAKVIRYEEFDRGGPRGQKRGR